MYSEVGGITMRVFLDRADGGRHLAKRLDHYRGADAVVFGLPRGGVVTAKEVAEQIGAPLDLIVARKISHPLNPEFAIGAVTDDGDVALNMYEAERVEAEWLVAERARQIREAQRRDRIYLAGRPAVPVWGKTAIVVDDGIATGYTIEAAIMSVRKREPAKIVVASPVAAKDVVQRLLKLADEVVVVEDPTYLYAVSQAYADFSPVSDDAVIELMREASFV